MKEKQMTTTTTPNLRESRKQTAAAKKAAAKPAAPAKKVAPAAAKLRWSIEGERDSKGRAPATAGNYAISGSGDSWKATVTVNRKATTLAEGSFGKCYGACVADNRKRA
jgi:hypothetical protein